MHTCMSSTHPELTCALQQVQDEWEPGLPPPSSNQTQFWVSHFISEPKTVLTHHNEAMFLLAWKAASFDIDPVLSCLYGSCVAMWGSEKQYKSIKRKKHAHDSQIQEAAGTRHGSSQRSSHQAEQGAAFSSTRRGKVINREVVCFQIAEIVPKKCRLQAGNRV